MTDAQTFQASGSEALTLWVIGLTPDRKLEVISNNEIDGHRAKILAWFWMSEGRYTQAWLLQELEEIPPPNDDEKGEAQRLFAEYEKKPQ